MSAEPSTGRRSNPFGYLIGIAFAGHLVNVIVVEPTLGFSTPDDFRNFDQIRPHLNAWVWSLGAFYHAVVALSLAGIAAGIRGKDRAGPDFRRLGALLATISAAFFLLVAAINVAGFGEVAAIAPDQPDQAKSGYYGLLAVRAAVLSAAVFALGGSLVCLSLPLRSQDGRHRFFLYFQGLLGLICLVFMAWPPVAPAVLIGMAVWGFWSGYLGSFTNEQPG